MLGFQLAHTEADVATLQNTIADYSKRVSNSTLWFTNAWKEIHDKVDTHCVKQFHLIENNISKI